MRLRLIDTNIAKNITNHSEANSKHQVNDNDISSSYEKLGWLRYYAPNVSEAKYFSHVTTASQSTWIKTNYGTCWMFVMG